MPIFVCEKNLIIPPLRVRIKWYLLIKGGSNKSYKIYLCYNPSMMYFSTIFLGIKWYSSFVDSLED